jgi:hypothetical protein
MAHRRDGGARERPHRAVERWLSGRHGGGGITVCASVLTAARTPEPLNEGPPRTSPTGSRRCPAAERPYAGARTCLIHAVRVRLSPTASAGLRPRRYLHVPPARSATRGIETVHATRARRRPAGRSRSWTRGCRLAHPPARPRPHAAGGRQRRSGCSQRRHRGARIGPAVPRAAGAAEQEGRLPKGARTSRWAPRRSPARSSASSP